MTRARARERARERSFLRVWDQGAEGGSRGDRGALFPQPGGSRAHLPEAGRGAITPGPPSAQPRGLLSAYDYLKPGI